MAKSALQDSLKRSQENNDEFYDVINFKKYYPKQHKKWKESGGKTHGWSRVGYGKDEGLYLKKKGHPSLNEAFKDDKKLGYSIYEKQSGQYKGRIYSFPKNKPVDTKVFKKDTVMAKKMFKSILKKYGKKKGKGLYYALERNRKKKKKGY